jgi:alkanesulfonate monooxygenase SsuD/methylene tetrahydromethanopterin reductase-like flavin-dependent oxidoreductase (luciferase family)
VWEVIGAPSEVTSLHIATAVICPTMRIHPAVLAQAAATAAVQRGGRFVLGVGSGEALNEHIFGDPWPWVGARLDILEEAVSVIIALHRAARSATAAVTTPCRTPASTPVPRSPYPFMCRGSLRKPPSWPAGSATATAWPCPTPTGPRIPRRRRRTQAGPGEDEAELGRRPRRRRGRLRTALWATCAPRSATSAKRQLPGQLAPIRLARSPRPSRAGPTPTGTQRKSRLTPTQGSTRPTSSRSGPTWQSSSPPGRKTCCPVSTRNSVVLVISTDVSHRAMARRGRPQ